MKLNRRFQTQAKDSAVSGAGVLIVLLLFGLTTAGFAQTKLTPLRVRVGEKAPNFTLPSANGKEMSLSSFTGHNVLLDFYEGYW